MLYDNPQILSEPQGNNAFAWEERTQKYGKSPTLTIPSLIEGGISDIQIGDDIVFEEIEGGKLKSCVGLRNFVRINRVRNDENSKMGVRGESTVGAVIIANEPKSESSTEGVWLPLETFGTFGHKSTEFVSERASPSDNDKKWKLQEFIIFDNHNHALYFWVDAVKKGILQPGFTLIHIDEHSDLWENPNTLDLSNALQDEQYAGDFTNLSCNVGNYIQPAIKSGLMKDIIRIENESQIDEYMNIKVVKNTVLNLDLDIFAPELDFIPEDKKICIIRNLLQQVDYVTIATSPFFIDQGTAIKKLQHILESE